MVYWFICSRSFWLWFIWFSSFLVLFICLNSFLFLFICFDSCIHCSLLSVVFLIHRLVIGKYYYQVVCKCLGLISSLWDHDLRQRPSSNPKNIVSGSRKGYGVHCLSTVSCLPALIFSVIFPWNRLQHVPPPSLPHHLITNKPSQSPSNSLFSSTTTSHGVHHSLYEL